MKSITKNDELYTQLEYHLILYYVRKTLSNSLSRMNLISYTHFTKICPREIKRKTRLTT